MGDSAGAVMVLLLGLVAFMAVIALAVSMHRLDRREHGRGVMR